ncbi:MAG: acetoin dehydrogenase [Rickettsiales bacterium]|nr:acetoin dehydrogenase [Rickettsiales bacterium]
MMSDNSHLNLFTQMLRIRRIEEFISMQYKFNKMRCPVHLSIGQEAVPVGICSELKKTDYTVSAHRSHAHYLAKGCNLKKMISELFGKFNGCASGKGGSMHLIDPRAGQIAAVPIVGSSISIGTGVGWAVKLKKINKIVCIFFGDGATESGAFLESLNFASLHNLPIIFVCENNFYSVYSDLSVRQSRNRSILGIAKAHGIKTFKGNGNDILTVNNIAKTAIKYLKENLKPVFIEFKTFRWLEHCGPNWDDHLKYRKKGELNKWMKNCPIDKIKKILLNKKILNSAEIEILENKIQKEIFDAFKCAERSHFPKKEELFTNIYS